MSLFKPCTTLVACTMGAALILSGAQMANAEDYESFTIGPGFTPDPLIGTGLSGGSRNVGECGFVDAADAPDHVLYVTEDIESLRLYVEAPGDVTLFLENADTGETLCIDDSNGTVLPDLASYWSAGTYGVWIGDFEGDPQGVYRYELYITEY